MNNTILTITADRNPSILLSGISWYKLSLWTTQFYQSQRTETHQFCYRVSPGTNCRYEQHNSNNHSWLKPINFVIEYLLVQIVAMNNTILTITADRNPAILLSGTSSQRTETQQFFHRVSPGTNNTILTITADRNPAILLSGISWYKLSLWTTQF